MRNEISQWTDQIFKYLTWKELETVWVSQKAFWDWVINMHIEETWDHDIRDYSSAPSTKSDLANNLLKEWFGEN